jgi:hypothetical protein
MGFRPYLVSICWSEISNESYDACKHRLSLPVTINFFIHDRVFYSRWQIPFDRDAHILKNIVRISRQVVGKEPRHSRLECSLSLRSSSIQEAPLQLPISILHYCKSVEARFDSVGLFSLPSSLRSGAFEYRVLLKPIIRGDIHLRKWVTNLCENGCGT